MSADFSDKWAFSILGISSIFLLFIIATLCVSKFIVRPTPQKIKVEWAMVPNDTLMPKNGSPVLLDSIQSVLSRHEQRVAERVEYVIEKREQEEDARTAVAVIVGFCISVFAFFGYKSFKDIKKEAVEIAATTARRTAETTIESRLSQTIDQKFHDIYNQTMRQTIEKEINDKIPSTLKSQINEYIESLSIEHPSNENPTPEEMFE